MQKKRDTVVRTDDVTITNPETFGDDDVWSAASK